MTVSFHKAAAGFPFAGVGSVDDVGVGRGSNHSINVPLHEGVDDKTFTSIFGAVISKTIAHFAPNAVVLQCGVSALAGDRLGQFNLSCRSFAAIAEMLRDYTQ